MLAEMILLSVVADLFNCMLRFDISVFLLILIKFSILMSLILQKNSYKSSTETNCSWDEFSLKTAEMLTLNIVYELGIMKDMILRLEDTDRLCCWVIFETIVVFLWYILGCGWITGTSTHLIKKVTKEISKTIMLSINVIFCVFSCFVLVDL